MGKYDKYVQTGATGSKYDKYLQPTDAEGTASGSQAMPAANQPIPQASAAPQRPVDIMGANVNQMDAQGPDPSRIPGMTDYLQQSASEYEDRNRGGIQGSADAALFNIANMATFGGLRRAGNEAFEGTVNEGYGDAAVKESNTKYPGASVVGRGIGFAYPSAAPSGMAMRGTEHLATKAGVAMTKSTSVPGRVARYGTRVGIGSPVVASEIAAFEALSEAPTRAFMEGRQVKPAEMGAAALNAMGNPVNYLAGPALSIAGRTLKGMGTGVSTPKPIQQGVTRESGGAVPLSEGQLAADAVQILDAQAMNGIDPSGFKLVERILRQSGVGTNDIPAVNAKVSEILKAAPDTVAPRLTIGQVYAQALYDLDKTQASENILKVLRERRNVTDVKDRSPSIVGNEVRDLRSSQVDFVGQSAESNLGAGKRIDIKNAAEDAKTQIGTEYQRVIAEADPARPEARELSALVIGDQSKSVLVRRAKNAGFKTADGKGDVDAYALARPDDAAHWLRSHLAKASRSSQGRERVDLGSTVQQLDELLDTNPGYAKARQDYGTEIGVDEAREIGNNFIAAARNQGNLDLLLEQIAALPSRERDVALLSIRDNLMSPVRGSGEDAPARISQLVSVGTLDGMERLGPAGKRLADDIRAIRDENNFLGQIDSGNPLRQSATFSNADAAANAPDLYSGGIARTMNAGGGSSLPADIAVSAITGTPIAPFTLAKIARGGLQSVFAPGRKSKEAMTQFLMTRPRNTSPGNALATPPASSTAPPTPPGGPVSSAGVALRSDAGNALSGAYAGSVIGSVDGMNNDINGDGVIDRKDAQAGALRGMAIGAVGVPAYTRTSNALATRAYSKGVPAEVKTLAERMHKASPNRGGAFKDAPAAYRTRLEAQAAQRLGVKIPEPPLAQGMGGSKPPRIKPDVPLGTRSRVRQPLPDVTGDTVEPNRRLVKVMSEPAPKSPPRGRGDYNQKQLYTVRRQPTDTPGDLQKGDRLPAEGLKKKQNPILEGQGDGDRQWVLLSDSASGAKKAFERGQGMRKKNGNVQDVLYRGQAKTVNVPDTIFGNGKRMRDLVQTAFDDGAGVVKLVFRNGREVYVAKDASVLRSPRAGFDPAKSGSKDIMAVLPIAGVGGAGAVAMHDGRNGNALALPPRNEQGQFMKEAR